ncbi:type II toxin-antitoxin system RelE/ParE family toxin [Maribellus sediminis]|uniref:type II toxin-antitoxin system RelE/ParE family toxin n=1 Tax=Maribellus sediminis TaxID=2696285 RepID=UPI001431C880|nr:type II toxin-antitoxin system RelE/ParE family toxin [Maribellus sediminis]
MDYRLVWTNEAVQNLEVILTYLGKRWTDREINLFKQKLSKLLDLITKFPGMFPKSGFNEKLHKAVLSKQTTLFYLVEENSIYLVSLFITYQDENRIKRLK